MQSLILFPIAIVALVLYELRSNRNPLKWVGVGIWLIGMWLAWNYIIIDFHLECPVSKPGCSVLEEIEVPANKIIQMVFFGFILLIPACFAVIGLNEKVERYLKSRSLLDSTSIESSAYETWNDIKENTLEEYKEDETKVLTRPFPEEDFLEKNQTPEYMDQGPKGQQKELILSPENIVHGNSYQDQNAAIEAEKKAYEKTIRDQIRREERLLADEKIAVLVKKHEEKMQTAAEEHKQNEDQIRREERLLAEEKIALSTQQVDLKLTETVDGLSYKDYRIIKNKSGQKYVVLYGDTSYGNTRTVSGSTSYSSIEEAKAYIDQLKS